jgi:hypothetical protein
LSRDARRLRNRLGGSNEAARNEAPPALVLAREYENLIGLGNMLPPYMVFCAVKTNVRACVSSISALIANAMFFLPS